MEATAFFKKDKSCIIPKLRLKLILLFYKNRLEIKSCVLEAILKTKIMKID